VAQWTRSVRPMTGDAFELLRRPGRSAGYHVLWLDLTCTLRGLQPQDVVAAARALVPRPGAVLAVTLSMRGLPGCPVADYEGAAEGVCDELLFLLQSRLGLSLVGTSSTAGRDLSGGTLTPTRMVFVAVRHTAASARRREQSGFVTDEVAMHLGRRALVPIEWLRMPASPPLGSAAVHTSRLSVDDVLCTPNGKFAVARVCPAGHGRLGVQVKPLCTEWTRAPGATFAPKELAEAEQRYRQWAAGWGALSLDALCQANLTVRDAKVAATAKRGRSSAHDSPGRKRAKLARLFGCR